MADDLDDLLDEVEEHLSVKKTRKSTRKYLEETKSKKRLDDDINDILDDVIEDDIKYDAERRRSSLDIAACAAFRSGSGTFKCFPVYIGGSNFTTGIASQRNQRACDKLRCTDCDFKCVMYDNYKWKTVTDYLFLRNNVPDFKKLKQNLLPEKGFRAYACQCKWRSVKELTNIYQDPELKWVCGKHD